MDVMKELSPQEITTVLATHAHDGTGSCTCDPDGKGTYKVRWDMNHLINELRVAQGWTAEDFLDVARIGPAYLLSELVAALQPEGSDLLIQKASSHNLDWTFRVRYNNGVTGGSVARTGSWLEGALAAVLADIPFTAIADDA